MGNRNRRLSLVSLGWIASSGLLLMSGVAYSSSPTSAARALNDCAKQWESQPFGKITEDTKFRTITGKVRVMGIGSETVDDEVTDAPVLILIEPSVNVLTKTLYRLLNPNGYYCLKSKVAVLAKTVIVADCKAHIAATQGTDVLASNDGGPNQGVGVLASSQIERVNCKKKPEPSPNPSAN